MSTILPRVSSHHGSLRNDAPRRAGTASRLAAIATILLLAAHAAADLRLPSVFGRSMVLQRERPVPVFGTANPGVTVRVALRDADGAVITGRTGEADDEGRFLVMLPSLRASSEPLELVVTADGDEVLFEDVLVGEVWFCGGQSNMEWPIAASNEVELARERARAAGGRIRMISPPHRATATPQTDQPGEWIVARPDTVDRMSAVSFWMASMLVTELDVPVGILSINWGGTRIEPWIPRAELAAIPTFRDEVRALEARIDAFESTSAEERERQRVEVERANARAIDAWWNATLERTSAADDDDDDWSAIELPATWEDATGENYDGLAWFRRQIELPSGLTERRLTLELGRADDAAAVLVNGTRVGTSWNSWSEAQRFDVPAELAKAGSMTIDVCVLDTGGAGGLTGPRMRLASSTGGTTIDLSGTWHWRKTDADGAPRTPRLATVVGNPGTDSRAPGTLYDAMVAPYVPYALRGFTWYQGESNASEPARYRVLLPALIDAWRNSFRANDLAFGIVQLAAFRAYTKDVPVQMNAWPDLRDAQFYAHRLAPRTGLVVTTDVGAANDIHPRDKRTVGERLAAWALHDVYERTEFSPSGPLLFDFEVEGNEVIVRFEHAEGLTTNDGDAPGGFAIAGADGEWKWATARIDGETIRVSHPQIAEPESVRYGWHDNPLDANVVNGAGLPASPFRTD